MGLNSRRSMDMINTTKLNLDKSPYKKSQVIELSNTYLSKPYSSAMSNHDDPIDQASKLIIEIERYKEKEKDYLKRINELEKYTRQFMSPDPGLF